MTHSTPSGSSSQPSRRRTITLVTGTTGVALAIVVGVSACGSSGSSSSTPASSTSAAASSSAKPGMHHGGKAVFGTIASENAGTWTLTEKDGTTETVTITPQTVFGTKKTPAQQSQFALGEMVAVRGQQSGTTITAKEINQVKPRPSATPSTPAAPTSN